ncbi:MAG: translation initiation factor IF-2 [Candidatus Wildermuthbacteria bacterium]|nr:translation initiation factor IF-2 [Candidatus Wildermuthbacteria bacterium]
MDKTNSDNPKAISSRPPVVVMLGHVDHGKSSLLEAIRKDFRITSKESGGITQHIGAYVAEYQGKKITFLDTPGHEAFSAMRSRGAKVADVAVLVVAADEGIKPQTKEAIDVIAKAKLPFIVAIHKVDKPGADPARVKADLGTHGVYLESMGGNVPFVETSATTKQGISELLEMVLLVSEVEGLETDPAKPAEGLVVETSVDSQRGPAATLLVLNGVLQKGDIVGTKSSFGKARILEDWEGASLDAVPAGTPVLVIGFEQSPGIGEEFKVFPEESSARANVVLQEAKKNIAALAPTEGGVLPIILKADFTGSLEALEAVLHALPQEAKSLKIIFAETGDVNEKDVKLAQGTEAKIYAFRVKTKKDAGDYANREHIGIETFDIIYDLIQKVREALERPQTMETVRTDLGTLKVLAVFFTEKNRQIVGGRVEDGEIQKGSRIEVMRNGQIAARGKMTSLQKNKQETQLVKKGEECGIAWEGDGKIEAGDSLKFFIEERSLV